MATAYRLLPDIRLATVAMNIVTGDRNGSATSSLNGYDNFGGHGSRPAQTLVCMGILLVGVVFMLVCLCSLWLCLRHSRKRAELELERQKEDNRATMLLVQRQRELNRAQEVQNDALHKRKLVCLEEAKHEEELRSKRQKLDNEAASYRLETDRLRQDGVAQELRRKKDEDASKLQILSRPRLEMVEHARQVCGREVDTSVLQTLNAKGFKFFVSPFTFNIPAEEHASIKRHLVSALGDLPENMKEEISSLLADVCDLRGVKTSFTFTDGVGTYSKVVYKSAEVDGVKSVAVLPFGMHFECAKVLERTETTRTPFPVYEGVLENVLDSETCFGLAKQYHSVTRKKLVRFEYEETIRPIFKDHVMSVDLQNQAMDALEFLANKKVLESIAS